MTLRRVDYNDNQHRTYAEGRRMPAARENQASPRPAIR